MPARPARQPKVSTDGLYGVLKYGPEMIGLGSDLPPDRQYVQDLGMVAEAFVAHRNLEELRAGLEAVAVPWQVGLRAEGLIDRVMIDASLVLGDFEPAWEAELKEGLVSNIVLWYGPHVAQQRIRARDFRSPKFEMTVFGRDNLESQVYAQIDQRLREHQQSEGRNVIESFYQEWAVEIAALPDREAIDRIRAAGFENQNRGGILAWVRQARDPGRVETVRLGRYAFDLPDRFRFLPPHAHVLLEQWFADTAREAENAAREQGGTHRIGEGWISETLLAAQLEAALPEYELVRHARPSWLAPQHLDVYIPSINVGIEYQGEQHHAPVTRFGGEEGFRVTQARDARKRALCLQHGCTLIEVLPGYAIEQVIAEIRDAVRGTEQSAGTRE